MKNIRKKSPRRRSPHPIKGQELKYYGFHACLQLFASRPQDIIRVYVEQRNVKDVSRLLRWCSGNGKAYHIVAAEDIAKIADSVHHEGLCILAKERPSITFDEMINNLKLKNDPACLLYFDGVQNPHNVGSIMRVAAHFGVEYIIGERALLPKISPSAYRVAQGGAESVHLVPLDNITSAFSKLKNLGFHAVGTSSHGSLSLYNYRFHPRTIIVLGSESEGVNQKLMQSIKDTIMIPGTGLVESLNVSVATGLILGEYWRQTGAPVQ